MINVYFTTIHLLYDNQQIFQLVSNQLNIPIFSIRLPLGEITSEFEDFPTSLAEAFQYSQRILQSQQNIFIRVIIPEIQFCLNLAFLEFIPCTLR